MAVKLAKVREQLILALYDLLLSSDEDNYYYYLSQIREYIDPDISGAMAKIAADGLVGEKLIERGMDIADVSIFALTPSGIRAAEDYASQGASLDQYSLAPSSDLILDRNNDSDKISQLTAAIAEVQKQLAMNNAVAALPAEDKDIIANELASASQIASADGFRLRRLSAFILPALKFLSDKFVGTALGEAAKHLIKLLLGS